jgi:HlyD family secretion protein
VRRRRLALLATVLGLGAVAGLYLLRGRGGGSGPVYETAPVTRGPVTERVSATGTLSPLVSVRVGSQVTGRIQELYADFNTRVTRGQVIARIDPRLFESDVAKARANVASATAAVQRARAELADARQRRDRTLALVRQNAASQADADAVVAAYDSAQAQVASAEAARAQAQAALQQAETQLAYTTIVSPIDGVVISRDVDVGQTVSASLQAPVLFTIAEDLRKMEVHTNVSEGDVGQLQPDMEVEFHVDAYPLERFRGVVKEIRYSPQTVQNVVTYDAVVSVDNPDLKLRPGMTADVLFLIESRADALRVPNAALRFLPPAGVPRPPERPGERVVWVLDGEMPRAVPVQVGITDGQATEVVTAELEEGDRVITSVAEAGDGAAGTPRNNRRVPGRLL